MMLRNSTSTISGAATGDVTGDWFYIGNMTKATIMATASDAGTSGSVKIQVSNEASPGGPQMPYTPTIYLELASPSVSVSGTTVGIASPFDLAYQWARLKFTRVAGTTGTVTALFAAHD
jgi:hypothetical protein